MQATYLPVVLVLVEPQNLVNVGAVIRLMSNFGLQDLRLVEPAAFDPHRILGIAHGTERVVERVRRCSDLADALSDCTLVLGTTGRAREANRLVLEPRHAAPLLLSAAQADEAPAGRAAVLFGREQDGLSNEALDRCHGVITIPTHADNPSLNLGQAALVIAYELWQASREGLEPPPFAPFSLPAGAASGAEREAMMQAVEALIRTLYPRSPEPRVAGSVTRLRTLLMRAAPTAAEAEALANLCRHAALRME